MATDVEVWKDVIGYEGYYQVSSLGRIKSVERLVLYKEDYSGPAYKRVRERMLKLTEHQSGHLYVNLCKNSIVTRFFVHTLVLTAFVGKRPKGLECRHYPDRDPGNNKIQNLQWSDHFTNLSDREEQGTALLGSKSPMSKLTEDQATEIRKRYAAGGISQQSLGNEYGVGQATLSVLINKKTWKSVQ